jgi:glycosyltransferase involved in cell wall biosynthesis
MNILLSSYAFDPSIGGLETVSRTLATEFTRRGHQVKVVTQTRQASGSIFPFDVIRRPAPHQLVGLVRWADIYFQSHVSLILGWPLLLVHRPWVVTQHTWLSNCDASGVWKSRLKRLLLRFATVVAISRAIASELPGSACVIGSPYEAAIFHRIPTVKRENELVFVGRLFPDKGVHLILEALALLKQRRRVYRLTVVGSGPAEEPLRRLVEEWGLADQVRFVGPQRAGELAATLNSHRILVVPSLWEEPFGVVALEACACGCAVIGSESGGLPEAIGPCGVSFPNGDVEALADRIAELCSQPRSLEVHRAARRAHLARHTPHAVAASYLEIFESAIRAKRAS